VLYGKELTIEKEKGEERWTKNTSL
jgi:hypothetical protein